MFVKQLFIIEAKPASEPDQTPMPAFDVSEYVLRSLFDCDMIGKNINYIKIFLTDDIADESAQKEKSFMIKRRKAILLSLIVVSLLISGLFAIHWFTTVDAENIDGIAKQATAYLQSDEPMYIKEMEQRGNFLAALCSTVDGKMAMCVFDKDPVFKNRWKANGGKFSLTSGEISSWNYGSPDGEAVLVFCGGEIPEEVCWYTFTNDGIIYTCPVEEQQVLDIFILQDSNDINSYPIPLDKEKQEIK